MTQRVELITKKYQDAIGDILNESDTEKIMKKAERDDPNGYLAMYKSIVKAVETMLKSEDCIKILPLVVYGWMPTVLRHSKWDDKNKISISGLLNRKNGEFSKEEMEVLREFVNGSYIGVSKLLHFTDPVHWAIWDSNVYIAIEYYSERKPEAKLPWYCSNNYHRVDNEDSFNAYQKAIRNVAQAKKMKIREIEKRIFYVGRELKNSVEKQKRSVAQNTAAS